MSSTETNSRQKASRDPVQVLRNRGRQQGKLTFQEISQALDGQADMTPDRIEDIIGSFVEDGIRVVEEARQATAEFLDPLIFSETFDDLAIRDEDLETVDGIPLGDSLRLYLRRMGQAPPLNAEEERELGKRLKDAREQKRVDTEAQERMIEGNLRLVVSIARGFTGRGVSFQDLIQEGTLGLIRAVDRYDYEQGRRFAADASWWIRQAVSKAVDDQSRTIRVPGHMVEIINRVAIATRQLTENLGREPSYEEVGKEVGMTADQVAGLQRLMPEPLSLETPIGDDDQSLLVDYIEDPGAIAPDVAASTLALREQLEKMMHSLTEREREVIRLRYGLENEHAHSLEELSVYFGVSRERIRQIEAKALRKLRQPDAQKELEEYL